ncbi:MAG: hypothetical protein AB1782_10970 [Cyanobacteriota bacterium]
MNDSIIISNVDIEKCSIFNASAEELLANTLYENSLLKDNTVINGTPAIDFVMAYQKKKFNYQNATKIGQILIKTKKITNEQLERALEIQETDSRPIGEILVEAGYCTQEELENALKRQQLLRDDLHELYDRSNKKSLWEKVCFHVGC